MDAVLRIGRSAFAHALVLPLAWTQGSITAQGLRAQAIAGRQKGTEEVIQLQNKYVTKWLTRFLSLFTLCADGDFYLVILPLFLWNGTPWVRLFATHLTIVVTIGVPLGGLIKDALCVLRPMSPPVWRPEGQESMDTMGMKDYSYPSTHAINAVTNPGVFLLFSIETGAVQGEWLAGLTALVCGYTLLLSFSRLYLGAHVWSDIYFGWVVGAVLLSGYWFGGPKEVFEAAMLAGEIDWRVFGACLFSVAFVAPQPRPVSPTVVENFMSLGLLLGCVLGCALYYRFELGLGPSDIRVPTGSSLRSVTSIDIMRNVLGFTIVIAIRAILKPFFAIFFRTLLMANGGVKVRQGGKTDSKQESISEETELVWKDADIAMGGTALMASTVEGRTLLAQMFSKFTVYLFVALFIQVGAPWVFENVGV